MAEQEPDQALRAEVGKIMADPAYARSPDLQERVAQMYRDRYGTAPVTFGSGLSSETKPSGSAQNKPVTGQEGETPEDAEVRARTDLILAPLRTEWGEAFDRRYADARGEAYALFTGLEDAFVEVGSRLRMHYGPKGETAALKFLAELERIKQGG